MLGTVTKFEGKGHAISIADSSGATQTFNLTEQTIAEGYMGVTNGFKFQVQKGDRVRVVGTAGNGSTTALFVRAM
jgi:ATPase subunit of ABC transporter with duplicated ATPase domains